MAGKRYNMLPVAKGWYVYCLMRAEKLTYIGKTDSVFRRIGQHVDDGRQFDAIEVIKCKSELHMTRLEKELIRVLNPIENIIRYESAA